MTDAALIVLGHGAARTPDAGDAVRAHCRTLAATGEFAAVRPAFLRQDPLVADVLADSTETEVFLVPFFASLGHLGGVVAPKELGLDGPVTKRGNQTIRYTEAVGTHPGVAEAAAALIRRALAEHGLDAGETAIIAVGHGTPRNPASEADTRALAARLAERTGIPAGAAFLEVAPLIDGWREIADAAAVIVVPYLFAAGFHGGEDIPARLGVPGPGLAEVNGRRLVLCPPLGTLPEMAGLIAARARESV